MHFAVPARPFMERNAHVFLVARLGRLLRFGKEERRICVCTLCKLLLRVIYLAQMPSNPDSLGLFQDVACVCLSLRKTEPQIRDNM